MENYIASAKMSKNTAELLVDFINVGFGDSILIRQLGADDARFTMLVDTGELAPEFFANQPRRIKTIEHLKNENVTAIDLLVLTHFHRDHSAAALEIIQSIPIKEVWLDYFLPKSFQALRLETEPATAKVDHLNSFNQIITELEQRRVPIRVVTQSASKEVGALVIRAFPPETQVLAKLAEDIELIYTTGAAMEKYQTIIAVDAYLNKTCLLLHLEYQGFKLLLPADLTPDFWEHCQDDLNSHIIKAPHHGDLNSFSKELLAKTNPDYIVISVDNEALNNFPSPGIENFIKAYNPKIKVLYTDVMPGVVRENPQFVRFRIGVDGIAISY